MTSAAQQNMTKRIAVAFALVLNTAFVLNVATQLAYGEDSPMDQGIKEYTAGKYSDALSHLGGALNSEFNNAKLHYYMGSCYMKLRQNDAAVREFRIAYALEPTGTPGKYAKQALDSMGVDKGGGGTGTGSDVFTKGLQDQKALGRAISDFALQGSFSGQPYSGYTPGANMYVPGGNVYIPPGPPNRPR